MIEISHKTAATVALDEQASLTMTALPGIVGWLLGQSDVRVLKLDLCLAEDTVEYFTDHGSLTFRMHGHPDGTREIGIVCNTLVRGTREIGRQLCFQIVRRLIARTEISSILWQPTRQCIAPDAFTWHHLADAPQRLAS